MENLILTNSDLQTVRSWFQAPKRNQFVLVYFHGNAGSIADRASKVRPYLEAGFGVLLTGYRGFGGNPGSPTELGLYEDASLVLEHLKKVGIPPNRWVFYGESLGSAVATEMAYQYALLHTPVSSVVLEAPFTSMGDAAAVHYPFLPVRILVRDRYDSSSKIAKIDAPLMVVHGTKDLTIPQKLGQNLFELAKEPKSSIWVEGAGHNNLYDFGVVDQIIQFLKFQ